MEEIYNYDNITGIYIGSSEKEFDPIENLPLIPAHATDIPPLPFKEGYNVFWDNGNWIYKAIEKEIPEKPTEYNESVYIWDSVSFSWVIDPILKAKVDLQAEIKKANSYLTSTDWVESYILRHDLGLNVLPEDSDKLAIYKKREELKAFIKANSGVTTNAVT